METVVVVLYCNPSVWRATAEAFGNNDRLKEIVRAGFAIPNQYSYTATLRLGECNDIDEILGRSWDIMQNLDIPWTEREEVVQHMAYPTNELERSSVVGDVFVVPGHGKFICASIGWVRLD